MFCLALRLRKTAGMPGFALPQLLLAALVQLCTAPLYVPAGHICGRQQPARPRAFAASHPRPGGYDSTETALEAPAQYAHAARRRVGRRHRRRQRADRGAARGAPRRVAAQPGRRAVPPFGWEGAEPLGGTRRWRRCSTASGSASAARRSRSRCRRYRASTSTRRRRSSPTSPPPPSRRSGRSRRRRCTSAPTQRSPPRWGSVSAPPAEVGRSCTQVHLRWAAPHHMGGSPRALRPRDPKRRRRGDGAWSAGDPLAALNRLGRPRARRALLGARARVRGGPRRELRASPATRRRPSSSTAGGARRASRRRPAARWAAPSSAAATST